MSFNFPPYTNPLNLIGQDPVNLIQAARDPAATDNVYPIGTEWQNTVSGDYFKLVTVSYLGVVGSAKWDRFASSTANEIVQLTPDSGGAVGPTVAGNLNTLGTAGLVSTTGSPGTNTVTWNLDASVPNSFAGNSGTATPAAHVLNVVGTAGQISVAGSGSTLTLSFVAGGMVSSFQPDTGTNPVVPTGAGLVKILGQATPNTSGVRVSGGTNELDIALFSPFEGDFSFTQSSASSATERTLTISNADTANATSNSSVVMSTGGASAGDPKCTYTISGATSWSIGIDNSDSDKWKVCQSTALGTNDSLVVDTTGTVYVPRNSFYVQSSRPAGNESAIIENLSTAAASSAVLQIRTANAAAANSTIFLDNSTDTGYHLGYTNDASNQLTLQRVVTGSPTNVWQMNPSGARVMPLQPAFSAVQTATAANVTGDGTAYTVICGTELYDQGSNYDNTTGVFTAPVTGRYHFSFFCLIQGMVAASQTTVKFVTTARNYILGSTGGTNVTSAANDTAALSLTVPMTAGDTCSVTVTVDNTGGKTNSIYGFAADARTCFSGELVC